jgi:hypothetical protein
MLIGIIACVVIMAVTLVGITINAQHNTYSDRMEVKADTVTRRPVTRSTSSSGAAARTSRSRKSPTSTRRTIS